jgi:hypothetical protein
MVEDDIETNVDELLIRLTNLKNNNITWSELTLLERILVQTCISLCDEVLDMKDDVNSIDIKLGDLDPENLDNKIYENQEDIAELREQIQKAQDDIDELNTLEDEHNSLESRVSALES